MSYGNGLTCSWVIGVGGVVVGPVSVGWPEELIVWLVVIAEYPDEQAPPPTRFVQTPAEVHLQLQLSCPMNPAEEPTVSITSLETTAPFTMSGGSSATSMLSVLSEPVLPGTGTLE